MTLAMLQTLHLEGRTWNEPILKMLWQRLLSPVVLIHPIVVRRRREYPNPVIYVSR